MSISLLESLMQDNVFGLEVDDDKRVKNRRRIIEYIIIRIVG